MNVRMLLLVVSLPLALACESEGGADSGNTNALNPNPGPAGSGGVPMTQPPEPAAGTGVDFFASASTLREVFKRDPFDFDSQHIDKLELTVNAGDVTRVTCTFDNPMDQAVGYGESTLNEMCYFIGFAVDLPRQSACLEVLPPNIFGN